jgi:hypothetical protein
MTNTPSVRPILVTGAHRTGTSWVGKMLAAAPETAYLSEPLNVLHRPGVFRAPVKHWYTYITAENEAAYLPAFRELLDFDYHLWAELRSIRSRRDFLRMLRDFGIFYLGSMHGKRALLKDPFAVFSAPWFAERLDCRVVITVRHPAGFASSLRRLGWSFDFRDLLDQPLLMRAHLERDRADMESMPRDDTLGQAALLWRMIYRVVAELSERHPDFIVVRHEDLSRDPSGGYRQLYQKLALEFTPAVERTILQASSSENPSEAAKRQVHSVKLDSRAAAENCNKRLYAQELARIRAITVGVSERYYAEAEWQTA